MGSILRAVPPSGAPGDGKDRDEAVKARDEAARAAAYARRLRAGARDAADVAALALEDLAVRRERLSILAGRNAYVRIRSALAAAAVDPRARAGLLTGVLDAAIALTRADMGHIQLVDAESGALKITAQRGFTSGFLDYFAAVGGGASACGAALEQGARVVVADVASSPIFAGTPGREVMLAAGAAAVQSTPLIAASGRVLGVLSTHYRRPRWPAAEGLRLLDALARQTAEVLERSGAQPEDSASNLIISSFRAPSADSGR